MARTTSLFLALVSCLSLSNASQCPFTKPGGTSASLWDVTSSPCPHASAVATDEWSEQTELAQSEVAPNLGQLTSQGCKCTSSCGATVSVGFFDCDWCYTEGDCGTKKFGDVLGLASRWDYCQYPADKTFEDLTASEKQSYFWDRVTQDKTRSEYPSVALIIAESIVTTFDNFAFKDEMPNGRVKYIHTVGMVCPFEMKVNPASPYTGLFQPGAVHGFIRMGSAASYSNGGLTPGLGLKFPRSGHPSGNFVALHSLDLGQSWNFFAYNVSNHISAPTGGTALLAKKFNQASQCAPQVGLSDMAKVAQDGTVAASPKTPFKLFMVPSAAVQMSAVERTPDQVNEFMASYPVGTTIYTVYACGAAASTEAEMTPTDGGLEVACAEPTLLGDIVSTAQCTSSNYGDTKFHIRHQRIEEDWELHPEFLEQYDAGTACNGKGGNSVTATGAPKKCGE